MGKNTRNDISITVEIDENNVPEKIEWVAESNGTKSDSNAMMLSFWDPKEKNTMKIDIWTKDMTVEEMRFFFHQTLLTMTDTFERATGEKKLVEDMRDFCAYFAMQTGIIKE